jgi:flagellar hook protein FlgE
MTFNVALSGLNAAQRDLAATSNNIANVGTAGFKRSRAEFGDVFSTSLLSNASTQTGDGVLTTRVAQQFSQGALQFTDNALDLAITGNGFFATVPNPGSREFSYTRAGQFGLNEDNFIVNGLGDHLLGFPVASDGSSTSVSLSEAQPIRIPDTSGAPQATTLVNLTLNLDSRETATDPADFDPSDEDSFASSTSVTIFDSLGDAHIQTLYFINDSTTANANDWLVVTAVDGQLLNIAADDGTATPAPPTAGIIAGDNTGNDVSASRLEFSAGGDLTNIISPNNVTPASGLFTTNPLGAGILTNGSDPAQTLSIDFNFDPLGASEDEPTQVADDFLVTSLEQDGLPVGRLTGVDIGSDGLLRAVFSNGTTDPIARITLARFANEQGLTQQSGTRWLESNDSGEALAGEANSGIFGTINSSAFEQSNVELTEELVNVIIAQRNFQANSRALDVGNQLTQNIINIR